MKNLGLTLRLVLAVVVLTALIIVVAAIGRSGIATQERLLADTYQHDVLALQDLKQASDAYAIAVPDAGSAALNGALPWADARQALAVARRQAEAAWTAYLGTIDRDDERGAANNAAASVQALQPTLDALAATLQREDRDGLRALLSGELRQRLATAHHALDQLADLQRQQTADKVSANASDEGSLKTELLVATAVAVVLAGLIAVLLARITRALGNLVRQVQTAGVQVSTSVTEIAATSKEQQATANEVAASTSEIGATAKEISATSNELVKTMEEVAAAAEQSASLAGEGNAGLVRMEETMRHVMDAAGAINAKLGVLNEKAGNINQVVTTITKVADQTNLLSLNASIEAEKAGEYGRGFAVVATEIRRLADQTAVATYDIEQIVKEMLSAVSGSVMGMDKFSEQVRRGVEEVRNVGTQLTQIIAHTQGLTPRFETVNGGMRAQAIGAQQISEALAQLSEAVHQTVESIRQSNQAITQLNETAGVLRTSVERIRT